MIHQKKETDVDREKQDRYAWSLLRNANCLAPYGSSLQKCGLVPINTNVTVIKDAEGVHYGGLVKCKSAWACPRCSPEKANMRGRVLAECHNQIMATGLYRPSMITYTIQHDMGEPLADLLSIVKSAGRSLRQGKRSKNYQSISFGFVSATEITYGRSGWHPHIHELNYLNKDISTELIAETLVTPYEQHLKKCGKVVRDITVNVTKWDGDSHYLTKGSAIKEVTGGFNKSRSMNIMGILGKARSGNHWHELYLEFIRATKRMKAVNTSARISKLYKVHFEVDKQASRVARDDTQHIVRTFTKSEWANICSAGRRYDVLIDLRKKGL